jgi:hypothetical protein
MGFVGSHGGIFGIFRIYGNFGGNPCLLARKPDQYMNPMELIPAVRGRTEPNLVSTCLPDVMGDQRRNVEVQMNQAKSEVRQEWFAEKVSNAFPK